MVTIATAMKIVYAFKNEACELLGIPQTSIRLLVIESSDLVWNMMKVIALDAHTIGISKEALQTCMRNFSFTPLRLCIYAQVCTIWKQKQGDLEFWITAIYYASALCLLKGLAMPYIPYDGKSVDEYFGPMLDFLKNQFGLEGKMFRLPGYNGYKMCLTKNSAEREMLKYMQQCPKKVKSFAMKFSKGTLENPFENIDEAVSFIRDLEEKAFRQDEVLLRISSQQYYYDIVQGQFRIPWASPYVAHIKNNYPKNSFIVSHMNTGFFCLKPNLYGRKFLYRGQNDYYEGKPCVPNIFRSKDHNERHYYLDFLIFSQEMELLIKSHPLVRLLERGIFLLHDKFSIRMNYQGLAQHYYNKSHFLDLTSDLNVMKFFATTKYHKETDSYIPCLDDGRIGVVYLYDIQFPMAFQQHPGYALKTIGQQVFMRSGAQYGFLLEMEYGIDFKKIPEVSAIYFRHDSNIAKRIFAGAHNGKDYFADDLLQHAWNDRLKKRFEEKVVSKEAVKLNVKRNPTESFSNIVRKLDDFGISVDDSKPCFSEEEMEMYYADIKNGWWEEFCDNIYFNGADGELYREVMKTVPKMSEYKWAFYKK